MMNNTPLTADELRGQIIRLKAHHKSNPGSGLLGRIQELEAKLKLCSIDVTKIDIDEWWDVL